MVDTFTMDEWIDRGRAAVAKWRDDQRQRAVRRDPQVQVRVREQVAVPQSAAEIWRFISDPANDGPIVGATHVRTFVVPGRPRVRSARCSAWCCVGPTARGPGSSCRWSSVSTGSGFAGRALSLGYRHLETATVADGLLTWEAVVETEEPLAGQVRTAVQKSVAGHLARIAALLDGDVPHEQVAPFVSSCDDRSALVDLEISVSADLRVTPEVAWAHVR